MNKPNILKRIILTAAASLTGVALSVAPSYALTKKSTVTDSAATTQAKIQSIITRGDTEITRRLTSLNKLSTRISGAQRLSATDKANLSSEVTNEISGLTALKTKLDADTDLTTTKADAQSIIADYRVYALIMPKVNLVRTADDQQVAEAKLTDLATKLQTRITAAQTAGKDISSLQTQLGNMNSTLTSAKTTSASIVSKVIGLQPSDYNSDHGVLSGDRDQLKAAQANITTATNDAQAIVASLKQL